jgi:hypothetical protein
LAQRLARYLEDRNAAPILLVGEAAGYRGARISGIPFTSERQLTGSGPSEATATIVHRVLADLDLGSRSGGLRRLRSTRLTSGIRLEAERPLSVRRYVRA